MNVSGRACCRPKELLKIIGNSALLSVLAALYEPIPWNQTPSTRQDDCLYENDSHGQNRIGTIFIYDVRDHIRRALKYMVTIRIKRSSMELPTHSTGTSPQVKCAHLPRMVMDM
jgi:hypothetical protein